MAARIDTKKIITAIRKSVPITITSHKVSRQTEEYIENILNIILEDFGLTEVSDKISYCLRELIVNAKKANTKRVFFEDRGLDITHSEDYRKGMETFKEDTLSNIDYYLDLQEKAGYYVKVIFQARGHNLIISIKNNIEISKVEQARVFDRVAKARTYHSMEDAFSEIFDESEGAGLGVVIMVLMLKKMGLSEEAFDIVGQNGVTTASLVLPMSRVRLEGIELIIDEIVNGIESIPQFPENIQKLQKLMDSEDSSMMEMAKQISVDPAMTADILKLVNSAQFMLPNKVENVVSAVSLIGLRGLRNLLLRYGAEKTLQFEGSRELWSHSHLVAFAAYSLASAKKLPKAHIEDAYMGGILHDIGKVVFANVSPELMNRFQVLSGEKNIERRLIEDVFAGLNHAKVGARIAEKWNFPENLVVAIEFHHDPEKCPDEMKGVAYSVCLANLISHYNEKLIVFDQIDQSILSFFNIRNEEQFNHVVDTIVKKFEQERSFTSQ